MIVHLNSDVMQDIDYVSIKYFHRLIIPSIDIMFHTDKMVNLTSLSVSVYILVKILTNSVTAKPITV